MRIDEALAESKPLDVKFSNGAVLHIEYAPPSFTIEEMEKSEEQEDKERIIELLQTLVLGWDLTRALKDDAGQPVRDDSGKVIEVPVDVSNRDDCRKYVKINIINEIIRAIKEDNNPGEA